MLIQKTLINENKALQHKIKPDHDHIESEKERNRESFRQLGLF